MLPSCSSDPWLTNLLGALRIRGADVSTVGAVVTCGASVVSTASKQNAWTAIAINITERTQIESSMTGRYP